MFPAVISNSNSVSENRASIISSGISRAQADFGTINSMLQNNSLNPSYQQPQKTKKKRNLPGNPDPDAEVIALSPKTLLATNRFVCEICNKGFQRDQNLQLHRRGHNLPWKLKQIKSKEIKKRAYVCPVPTCLHNHPSRALGDLTGIKKHYCRKHGEKKWKCEKCSKIYAVQSDWKAHSKTCGTREYRCDCGILFSRKDSFITHRAFCDALAEESAKLSATTNSILSQKPNYNITTTTSSAATHFYFKYPQSLPPPPSLLPFSAHRHHHSLDPPSPQNPNPINSHNIKHEALHINNNNNINIPMMTSPFGGLHVNTTVPPPLSATALLQKAAAVGSTHVGHVGSTMANLDMHVASAWQNKNGDQGDDDRFTRDFLGLTGDQCVGGGGNVKDQMLTFTGGVKFPAYDIDRDNNSLMKHHKYGFGFTETCSGWGNG